MGIPFKEIPSNLLVPGMYQEIDNSLAGSVSDVKKALIIATMMDLGSAKSGVALQVRSRDKAKALFGDGSPAAIMAGAFLDRNTTEELFVLPVKEPDTGVKWKEVFTVNIVKAADGAVDIVAGGFETSVAISEESTNESLASSIVAAINSAESFPIGAEVDSENSANIIVQAKTKGESGNGIKCVMTSDVAGVSIDAGDITEGKGTPDIAGLLKGLGATRYHYWASEFCDGKSIKAISDELKDRYTAMRQIGGRCFISLSGEIGDVSSEGTMLYKAESINSPHIVLVPHWMSGDLPCVWSATWCAVLGRVLADDPAANTSDTELLGLTGDEMSSSDRDALLNAGISTYRVDTTGTVLAERVVTSYTENSDGARDTSYLDVQVVETVDAIRTYINQMARKRFKRWKLARTEESFGPGSTVMTPGVWKGFLAELYQEHFIKEVQWCQDFKSYISSIFVEVKADSKTRLEYRHRPVLIGQFYQGCGLNQFE